MLESWVLPCRVLEPPIETIGYIRNHTAPHSPEKEPKFKIQDFEISRFDLR